MQIEERIAELEQDLNVRIEGVYEREDKKRIKDGTTTAQVQAFYKGGA